MRPAIPPDQEIIYRQPDVITITGRGRATIYRDIAAGTFPAPVRLGEQSVGWRKSDVDEWIASRPRLTRARRR
jgi:prophage regulatory protein